MDSDSWCLQWVFGLQFRCEERTLWFYPGYKQLAHAIVAACTRCLLVIAVSVHGGGLGYAIGSEWESVLYVIDCCTFKKQLSRRDDHCFHCFFYLCAFSCCLLSRTRKWSSLPEMNDWDSYMNPDELSGRERIDTETFRLACDFGKELQRGATNEVGDFRTWFREFQDWLVDVILSLSLISSDVMQGEFSHCEGDDQYIFRLFNKLMVVLKRCVWTRTSRKLMLKSLQLTLPMRGRDILLVGQVPMRFLTLLLICLKIIAFYHVNIRCAYSSCDALLLHSVRSLIL